MSRNQNTSFLSHAIADIVTDRRIGYMLLYCPGMLIRNTLEILTIWHGGISIQGGLLEWLLQWLLFAENILQWLSLADICFSIAPFDFLFSRIANFINRELYGKIVHIKWAVIFHQSGNFMANLSIISALYPSQLYEAFLEGLTLFSYMQIRF
jgi:phosphatidylglycerol:prolipoprotein diacylglycerol transferase